MAKELWTLKEIRWEFFLNEILKLFLIIFADWIPEFGGSMMIEVDACQIHIFNMPSKQRSVAADVKIRIGDSRKSGFSQSVS